MVNRLKMSAVRVRKIILGNVRAITTDSTIDMCSAMSKLCTRLNIRNNTSRVVTYLHVRCIADVVNPAIGDYLKDVHGQMDQIRSCL